MPVPSLCVIFIRMGKYVLWFGVRPQNKFVGKAPDLCECSAGTHTHTGFRSKWLADDGISALVPRILPPPPRPIPHLVDSFVWPTASVVRVCLTSATAPTR